MVIAFVKGLVSSAAMVAILVPSAPLAAAPTVNAQYLPNCLGVPVRQPKEIIFACGDGGIRASDIRWRGWGGYYAYGSGRMVINDCDPNCASGHYRPYEASFIAFGKQTCPNGEIAYRGIKLSYSRIYTVSPYTVAGHTYTTRLGPLQEREQDFFCKPMM